MKTLPGIRLALCAFAFYVTAAHAAGPAPAEVTLTKRANNGPYGTAAYSFRLASQDYAVHRNYVDLVFNGCGLLHINPVNGMKSRVADCGAVALESATHAPAENAPWHQDSIAPQAGHVYYQQIDDGRQKFDVRVLVTDVGADAVKLKWEPVDPAHQSLPLAAGKGAAGTQGQCGGKHAEE